MSHSEEPVPIVDGPMLRAFRQAHQVPLRKVARQAGMSHGHLSKVERGELGRPVTPAVLTAYQRATGVHLLDTPAGGNTQGEWQPGQLGGAARRSLLGRVAALAAGGPLGETIKYTVESRGQLPMPQRLEHRHATQLLRLALTLVEHEGPIPGMAAQWLLRWAAVLPELADDQEVHRRAYVGLAHLAKRAARTAADIGSHEQARTLLQVAVHTAATADEPDLRARVLADLATHLHAMNHWSEAATVARQGEVDERVSDDTRKLLHEIKQQATDAAERLQQRLKATDV